jgi:hypothetical protein
MVCVVIPIYKSEFSQEERVSFIRFLKVLGHFDTKIVCPKGLRLPLEVKTTPKLKIERFDPVYFRNIAGYNDLLLSKTFYARFLKYNYILIYQLDAYVFQDQLVKWCNEGYDYIGAPWFDDYGDGSKGESLFAVGNGGLSLRHVKNHYNTLQNQNLFQRIRDYFWCLRSGKPCTLLGSLRYTSCQQFINSIDFNEDIFWSLHAVKFNDDFQVCPVNKAMSFSFENGPKILFELNQKKLPFGCHKWENKMDFWSEFIPIE